jgi:excisionase family DNA binding protein
MSSDHTRRSGFSARALARELGISKATISTEIRAGRLRAARVGKRRLLILAADVDSWLETCPALDQEHTHEGCP